MAKTGTYQLVNGKMVKVSDRIPRARSSVWFPKRSKQAQGGGYIDEHIADKPVRVESKEHKRQLLKQGHLAEVG